MSFFQKKENKDTNVDWLHHKKDSTVDSFPVLKVSIFSFEMKDKVFSWNQCPLLHPL